MSGTLASIDYAVLQQCMHCGMCLPTCPTYDTTKRERNSPRGRIALMRAIADGEMAITREFGDEMSYCLGCLACQTACPAGVNYAELFETARSDIGRDQHAATTIRRAHQDLVAVTLFHIAMQRERRIAAFAQLLADRIHIAFGIAEHQRRFWSMRCQQLRQRIHFARWFYLEKNLLDRIVGQCGFHRHRDRVALHPTADRADRFGPGRREQQRLPLLRHQFHDGSDRFLETHVVHAVGFVEHAHVQGFTLEDFLRQQVLDATRRTLP